MRFVFAFLTAATMLGQTVVLRPGSRLVIDPREPAAVRKAAADLAADLEKVFGAAPGSASPSIVISCEHNLRLTRPPAAETFRIAVDKGSVVIEGADVRGTIYGIYEFSHRYLGVDPLYFWTDHEPARQKSLAIPADLDFTSAAPAFRYRGWFINDEDLLTGWTPGERGGIALKTWDRIFEALLRLKGNMIVPGTFIFPDEPQVRAAAERGLIITQHHIEVLGTNTWRWPDDKPYSFAEHPQVLINAWRNAMTQYGDIREILWTVGYRGRHDRAFWSDDKSIAPTDEARGAAIRAAIDKQIEIVRARRPHAYFLMNAWMEAVPLIQKGALKLPEGVTLVWPDNGHGVIRDQGRIARGQGVYYHTAMHNALANQLTEMVPLERIERELGRAARAGATEYLLVNVSDVRPYPLTTRAVMEIAAIGADWKADEYLLRWCRSEFGDKAAEVLARYYRAYFEAPGRYGAEEHQTLADNAYHNILRMFLVGLIHGEEKLQLARVPGWLPRIDMSNAGVYSAEAEPRWSAARALAKEAATLVPTARWPFFQSHVLTQLAIHEHSNRALRLAAEAWQDRAQAPAKIDEAVVELRKVVAALEAAEYGKWRRFYKEDRFVDVRKSLKLAEACAAKLAGKPVPADVKLDPFVVDPYFWLKDYQSKRWVDTR